MPRHCYVSKSSQLTSQLLGIKVLLFFLLPVEKLRPGYGYSRDLLCIHPLLSHRQSMANAAGMPSLSAPSSSRGGRLPSAAAPSHVRQQQKCACKWGRMGIAAVQLQSCLPAAEKEGTHPLQSLWQYRGGSKSHQNEVVSLLSVKALLANLLDLPWATNATWRHGTQPRAHISQFCRPIRSISWAMPCPDHQAESRTWSYPSAMWSQQFKPPFTKRTSKKSVHGAQERKS